MDQLLASLFDVQEEDLDEEDMDLITGGNYGTLSNPETGSQLEQSSTVLVS